MPDDNNALFADMLWGEGMPPKKHEGRYAVLLLEKGKVVAGPLHSMEVREVSAKMLGPRGWKVCGYFVLPDSVAFWRLFKRMQGPVELLPVDEKPIDECEFSIRAHVRFQKLGIKTLGELAARADWRPNEAKLLKETKEVLAEHGLELVQGA